MRVGWRFDLTLCGKGESIEISTTPNKGTEMPNIEAHATTLIHPIHGETTVLFASEVTSEHHVVAIAVPVNAGSYAAIEFPAEARVREASMVGTQIVLVIQPDGTTYEDQCLTFDLPLSAAVTITL
jgi:hypothetical protein